MPKVKSKSSAGSWGIEPIPFVRSSRQDSKESPSPCKPRHRKPQNGESIRSFYESIVGLNETTKIAENSHESPTSDELPKEHIKRNHSRKIKIKTEVTPQQPTPESAFDYFKLRNLLLSAAEKGSVKDLQNLLSQGADVNCQDQYGWTALMCASRSGYAETVVFLLDSGADSSIRNAKNQSAWDIARISRNTKVIKAFEEYGKEAQLSDDESGEVFEDFFCPVCTDTIKGMSQEKHVCSTVHQLNMGHVTKDTAFSIPGHNRGFQLMLKSGWDQDKGLGPEGTGQKYPIKTRLKRDREGLGSKAKKQSKPKVTHFQAFDKKAVQHKERQERANTLSKRAESKRAKKEKEIERKFRMEFWTE